MGKLKLKVGAAAAKVEATKGLGYTGETPPAGVYKAVIKKIRVGESRSKKPMLTVIVEFEDKKGSDNYQYNGFAIFHRLIIPDDENYEYFDLQAGQINRVLDAISGNEKLRAVFWGGNADLDKKGESIIKIGAYRLAGKDFGGIPVVVSAKNETYNRKKEKMVDGKKKTVAVPTRTLRVNDIFPSNHEMPKDEPDTSDDDIDEDILDDDDVIEDEVVEDEVDTDDDSDEDEDDDDADDADDSDDDDDVAEGEYAMDDDGDPEDEDPEPEPEPEPKKTTRRRRSAF